jgi:hypothetical protein
MSRTRCYTLCALLGIVCVSGFSQQVLQLKTGSFPLLTAVIADRQQPVMQYLFYRPGYLLSTSDRNDLRQKGIEVLYALHDNTYWVRVKSPQDQATQRSLFDINPEYKTSLDPNTRSTSNQFRVSVAPGLSIDELNQWANQNNFTILDQRALRYGMIDVEIPRGGFNVLMHTPWISFINTIPVNDIVNYRAVHAERGWALISPFGRGLTGEGVTVGIGDGGRVQIHEDLAKEYLDLATTDANSTHATQTSGIVAGAGLIDPFYGFGYAPKAHVILRNFTDILWDAPQYFIDYGLTLTNNSYGSSQTDCTYMGDYDGSSAGLDAMIMDVPSLLHIFSSGNSAGSTCSPFSQGYATILGGYQPAKNVLTVGALNITDAIASYSSRGPVDDGRIKPEVCAYGTNRASTIGTNQYGYNSGTSFSSPATAGCATLLYERYKQLHNDSLPDAALIKNVICNAADDLGNVGPDFLYGFGRINGDRSAKIIEDNHFLYVNVDQGNVITRTFSIPSGTASADVMIMWTDKASAPYETVTLVNDLDMTIVTPAGDTLKPWILNCTPGGVSSPATTGVDRFNNYEQITLSNPAAGTYTIVTKGAIVPLGPQKAWITWDIMTSGIKVQSPNGGEVLKPGNVNVPNDRQYIRWDAYGTGSSTFTVEYSTDGGSSWAILSSSVPAANRYLDWFPPAINCEQLKVRVTASNAMQDVSDQNSVIMSPPTNLAATSPCNGNVQLTWTAINGITLYKVFVIKNETLIPIDTITGTSFIIHDLPKDSAIWVTVAGAFTSGATGLRARAIQVTANGGNACPWANDLRIDSLVNLSTGRKFTSTELSNAETITIHLSNLGTTNASGFSLSYQLNSGTPSVQAYPGTLNAASGTDFSFTKPADLSATGTYHIKAWSTFPSDPFHENDTLKITLHQLANPVVTLPWNEGFESAADTTELSTVSGVPGLAEMDVHLANGARLRTFAGTSFCHSGVRAITIDAVRTGSSKAGDAVLSVNLSSYHVANDDIRFSFKAMHHEIIPDVTNTEGVWIRGADNLPFVLLTMIPNDVSTRGLWQSFSGLKVSQTLMTAGQDFSSSFQIKFACDVYATAGQLNSEDGETIDDLSLNRIDQDITPTAITNPTPISCNLGMETIMVSVTNTAATPTTNASVSYRVNNGTIYSTSIGTVAANSTISVSLTPTYNFSTAGKYLLEVWTSSADDDFHGNDTLRTDILHNTLVNTFPYLEGFENGPGNWIAAGTNSSWAQGVPGKPNFSRAAEGNKEWSTSLSSTYNQDETSYLYSPCFDLTGLAQPYLSFALQYQLETSYDYAWVEYKLSGSNTWIKLGAQGSGVNWYNNGTNTWNGSQLNWTTTGIAIPVTNVTIQFRWVMQSDVGLEMEGLSIDQVHVYDRVAMYNGGGVTITQAVSGNNWVHFNSGGQRIFSINPLGQNLGNVTLTMYKSGSNFLLSDSLYLLSRNWVLNASNPPTLPIQMRGYFTATEATNLINASGCSQCISIRDGFDVAALRYTGSNQDGSYANDNAAQVTTYHLDSTLVVPYDIGFYAQWTAPGMSEWWITSTVTKWSGSIQNRISAGNDDAEEHEFSGAVNPYRESLALTEKDGKQKIGWRFRHVTIPKGSYIQSAHLEWTSDAINSAVANWTLQSELSGNAASFSTSKYNLSLRTRSNQVVQWSPAAWNTLNAMYNSPELKHLLQQIVDQSSWVTGHDLALLMKGDGLRQAWSYDGDSLKGAQLVVTYKNVCNETGICYVDAAATGSQDGNTWTNAYRSLEQALDRTAHCADIDEIWMADGTYIPYFEISRNNGFSIRPGVRIYGGFQGNETAINQRIYGMYPTIISGDIGTIGLTSDNLYHVFTIQSGAEETLLDGITIRDGMANGGSLDLQRGSAIYNSGNLKLQKVTIMSSSAPSVYNAPGAIINTVDLFNVKQ